MNWDYLAGFFDGEGYVTISEKFRWSDGCPHIFAGLSQKNVAVLNEIRNFLRSQGILVRQPYYHPPRKTNVSKNEEQYDLYDMKIGKRRHVLAFLKGVHPHLIVKKDLATKALSFLERAPRLIEPKHVLGQQRLEAASAVLKE